MDDEFLKLELELKALRLVEPSPGLQGRLASALPSRRSTVSLPRWSWLALPAAAALAVVLFSGAPRENATSSEPTVASAPAFKPISSENTLLASRDEGYVTLTDGTPAHRTRQMYLDTITWKNSQTNASLTWTVPREEVRVVPVAFQ
jgi:hypothetical protein